MASPDESQCPHCCATVRIPSARQFIPSRCTACDQEVWLRQKFGPFELRELLGRGEMSVVFRAFDPERGTDVALKIMRPPAAAMGPDVAAFVAAARRLRTLLHPNLAHVYGAGIVDGLPYVAMEYLPGPSLATRLAAEGPLSESEMLEIGLQAASALERAQNAGLPHRDFQPRRVRFATDGTVRVTGFAESIFLDCASMDVGIVRGTLCYVAPERLCGLLEDARSEIFTLGATLHEVVTGRKLHAGETHGEILRDLHDSETIRIEDAGLALHPATASALNCMLSVDLVERPQTWADAISALREARAAVAPEPTGSGRGKMLTLLLFLLGLAVGISAWTRSQEYPLTRVDVTPPMMVR